MNWNKAIDLIFIVAGMIFVLFTFDGIYLIAQYQAEKHVVDFLFWMPIGVAVTGGIGAMCLFMVYYRRKRRIVKARKD